MRFARAEDDNDLYHSRPSSASRKTRSSSVHGTEASRCGSASVAARAGTAVHPSHKQVTFDLSSPSKRIGSASDVAEDSSWCTLVRRYDAFEDRTHKWDSHASVASLRNTQIGGLRSTLAPASAKPSIYRESTSDGAATSRFVDTHSATSGRSGPSLGVVRGRGTPVPRRVTDNRPASSFSDADAAFGGLGGDTGVQKNADSFEFARSPSAAHGTVRGRGVANTHSPRGNIRTPLCRTVSNYTDDSAVGSSRHAGFRKDTELEDDLYVDDTFGTGKTTSQAVGPAQGRGAANAIGPRGRGGTMMGRTVHQSRICSDEPKAKSALDSTAAPYRLSTNVDSGSYDTASAAGTPQSDDDDNINQTSSRDSNAVGGRDGFGQRNVGTLSTRGRSQGLSVRGFGARQVQSRFGAAATETTNLDSNPPVGRAGGQGGPLHGAAESGSRLRDRSCDGAEQHHEGSSILSREVHRTTLHATVPTNRVSGRHASSTSGEQAAVDHTACAVCRHVQPSIGHLIVERAFFILALLVVAGAFLLLFFVTASDCPTKLNGPRY